MRHRAQGAELWGLEDYNVEFCMARHCKIEARLCGSTTTLLGRPLRRAAPTPEPLNHIIGSGFDQSKGVHKLKSPEDLEFNLSDSPKRSQVLFLGLATGPWALSGNPIRDICLGNFKLAFPLDGSENGRLKAGCKMVQFHYMLHLCM